MIKILSIFYRFLLILRVGDRDYLGTGVLRLWTGWGGAPSGTELEALEADI